MMFREKIPNDQDLDEAAKLSRRRQYEEERKKRIFDAKKRMYGVDLNYLSRQIADNKLQQSQQLEIKRRYDAQVLSQDQSLRAMELEEEQKRRMTEADINYYRCSYQRKDQTREYDLNDPEILKKSPPVRIGDQDLALGISSAQIFDGEDLGFRERRQRQFEQQRAWLNQQIRERKEAEISKEQAEQNWQEKIFERERCLTDMAVSEKRIRSKLQDSVHEYNRKMAQQKCLERERLKREEMEDDMAEIYNMLTSDMLAENPAAGVSCKNPGKRVAYLYRGMTPEEKVRFRLEQEEQKKRIAIQQEHNKLMEKQFEQYVLNMDRELKLKELELERREKEALNELLEQNSKLAAEQRAQLERSNATNKNEITEEFFKQFNTTSR